MSFHVGQKVVCVDDRNGGPGLPFGAAHDFGIRIGSIYTISRTFEEFVCLAEIDKDENGWFASRFRPLITRSTETGMAILRKVADDAAKRKNLVSL